MLKVNKATFVKLNPARRALEWIGMFKGHLVFFRYEILDNCIG